MDLIKFNVICLKGVNLDKQKEFEKAIETILEIIGEDKNREGLIKTPTRVYKAFMHLCSGYNKNPKDVLNEALFDSPNSEMIVVRDIEFYSLCEHHLLPVIGKAHIGYIPNGKVVGLSKIPRIVEIFARRLQLQERMTEQIADALLEVVKPLGVGVVVQARHMCMEMRGIEKVCSSTITSALRGQFLEQRTRLEFFDMIKSSMNQK